MGWFDGGMARVGLKKIDLQSLGFLLPAKLVK